MKRTYLLLLRVIRASLGIPKGSGILVSKRARVRLAVSVVLSLVIALMEVVALVAIVPMMQLLADPSTTSRPISIMGSILSTDRPAVVATGFAGLVLLLYVVKAIATMAFRWWQVGFIFREQVATSTRILDHYLRMPYVSHLKRTTSDLVSTLNDGVSQVYGLVISGSLTALADVFTIVVIVVTLLVLAPLPTLIAAVYFAVAAWLFLRWTRPRSLAYGMALTVGMQQIFRTATDGLGSIKMVLMSGNQDFFVRRYGQARLDVAITQRNASFVTELPKYVLEILFVLGIGLMMTVTLLSGMQSTLAVVALFAAAGFRTLPSIVRLLGSLNGIRVGRPFLAKIVADYEASLQTERTEPEDHDRLPFTQSIVVEGVSYTYPGNSVEVLRDVNLVIPMGRSTALVGSSGAGKTTLVDVVQGLLEPTSGRVLVDGIDTTSAVHHWRRQIGTVPQEVWMIEGSIRDNVAFGVDVDDIDDEAVWRALEQAQLGDFVKGLPDGINSYSGERGNRMSGGQRQRLGLARALYRQPSFLVLDEATSALDNETENRVVTTIGELSGEIATLVVAHRLSTVRHCDQIAFMRDGRVEAIGTFDDLATSHPEFARMVQLGRLD